MDDERIEVVFKELKNNMPRAPEDLVQKMQRTVKALEAGRQMRAGGNDLKPVRERAAERAAEKKAPKPPAMG